MELNISMKTKFSMILIFMVIVLMLFAYTITTGVIYFNFQRKMEKNLDQKKNLLVYQLNDLKRKLERDSNFLSEDFELISFFEGVIIKREIKEHNQIGKYMEFQNKKIHFKRFISNFEKRLDGYLIGVEEFSIDLLDKNGNYLELKENLLIEEKEEISLALGKWNKHGTQVSEFKKDMNNKLFLKVYSPVFDFSNENIIGGLIVSFKLEEAFFIALKNVIDAEIIVFDNDGKEFSEIIATSLKKINITKASYKEKELDIVDSIFKCDYIELKDFKGRSIANLMILLSQDEMVENIREISIYLFVALFFIFSLIFLISLSILELLVGSIKDLTLKINRLREGDFDISLGKLKKRNDEIGILAQDFEEMVYILKGKIDELKMVNKNKEEYSEQLEMANKKLEVAKRDTDEKSKNIDMINRMLNNRITEITNLYYMIINISKYITDNKFYNFVVKGIREGLRIRKVLLLENENGKFAVKSKIGVNFEIDSIDLTEAEIIELNDKGLEIKKCGGDYSFSSKFNTPYIIPMIYDKELGKKEIFGVIIIDNNQPIEDELKKAITTYIKTIVLAFENRKLYIRLLEQIDKLENSAKKLKESSRIKNIILGNISHELKIPLVPMKIYTEMMLLGKIGGISPKQRKGLVVTLKNVERLEEIIENLLNYSRIEGGTFQASKFE